MSFTYIWTVATPLTTKPIASHRVYVFKTRNNKKVIYPNVNLLNTYENNIKKFYKQNTIKNNITGKNIQQKPVRINPNNNTKRKIIKKLQNNGTDPLLKYIMIRNILKNRQTNQLMAAQTPINRSTPSKIRRHLNQSVRHEKRIIQWQILKNIVHHIVSNKYKNNPNNIVNRLYVSPTRANFNNINVKKLKNGIKRYGGSKEPSVGTEFYNKNSKIVNR
jgi:hypothetical protein